MEYCSLESKIRDLLEGSFKPTHQAPDGGPETDMNDQVTVGTYNTKNFEMSNPAQKFYSNPPKDLDPKMAEPLAILLDKLFNIEKKATVKHQASKKDVDIAVDLQRRIMDLASDLNLEKEHDFVNTSVNNVKAKYKEMDRIIDPEDHVHPLDDPRFHTPSKDYQTDRINDRDMDNTKQFLIRRGIKAQRKLKIIDND